MENTGKILWTDMTVDNADEIRDFYSAVIGWKSEEIEMNKGEYYDFSMYSEDPTSPTAGICNQKGPNKGLPTGWIVYFGVTDIKKSINRAMEFGGEILTEVREMPGYGLYCFLKDPNGHPFAIFQTTVS